jgi:hypothetical protein
MRARFVCVGGPRALTSLVRSVAPVPLPRPVNFVL